MKAITFIYLMLNLIIPATSHAGECKQTGNIGENIGFSDIKLKGNYSFNDQLGTKTTAGELILESDAYAWSSDKIKTSLSLGIKNSKAEQTTEKTDTMTYGFGTKFKYCHSGAEKEHKFIPFFGLALEHIGQDTEINGIKSSDTYEKAMKYSMGIIVPLTSVVSLTVSRSYTFEDLGSNKLGDATELKIEWDILGTFKNFD